jgi:hypothetical protein
MAEYTTDCLLYKRPVSHASLKDALSFIITTTHHYQLQPFWYNTSTQSTSAIFIILRDRQVYYQTTYPPRDTMRACRRGYIVYIVFDDLEEYVEFLEDTGYPWGTWFVLGRDGDIYDPMGMPTGEGVEIPRSMGMPRGMGGPMGSRRPPRGPQGTPQGMRGPLGGRRGMRGPPGMPPRSPPNGDRGEDGRMGGRGREEDE